MLYVVIIFLWTAILMYLLFGGADFGAGILELFTSNKNKGSTRRTMYRAIGPIWEANHMWLIIAIVILFVAFPEIYSSVSIYLHIPLVLLLLGIIARGTAFAFRHYDAVVDDMQVVYNRIFTWSSFFSPFFLGIIAASVVSGHLDRHATSFFQAYIYSWLDLFCISVGLFTVAICAFLAAIFLIGEAKDQHDRGRFIAKARTSNFLAIISGALVFTTAAWEKIPLLEWIFGNPVGITAIIAATCSLVILWYLLLKGKTKVLSLFAGFQVMMILLAVTYRHYPKIVLFKDGSYLSLLEHHGQEKTINTLGWALLGGSVFILPALFYLIYSFKRGNNKRA